MREEAFSGSSRTGEFEQYKDFEMVTSPEKHHRVRENVNPSQDPILAGTAPRVSKSRTFTRRPRKSLEVAEAMMPQAPPRKMNRKRGPKQVWMPVQVQVVGEGDTEVLGKRQRTASVFDRMEIPGEVQNGNQNNSVFNRLEDPLLANEIERAASVFNITETPSAVPKTQGRRSQ
jgi:hypothetical protein